tara:strand:- start:182 stop:319 length:138 start_codon:yes stop_codon:yes gene_type:complete
MVETIEFPNAGPRLCVVGTKFPILILMLGITPEKVVLPLIEVPKE